MFWICKWVDSSYYCLVSCTKPRTPCRIGNYHSHRGVVLRRPDMHSTSNNFYRKLIQIHMAWWIRINTAANTFQIHNERQLNVRRKQKKMYFVDFFGIRTNAQRADHAMRKGRNSVQWIVAPYTTGPPCPRLQHVYRVYMLYIHTLYTHTSYRIQYNKTHTTISPIKGARVVQSSVPPCAD